VPEYADIYCRQASRDYSSINEFLDLFLPDRLESADEYEFPQYSDSPEVIFTSADEAISYLSEKSERVHNLYWKNEDADEHAMISWLSDGSVIYGRSTSSMNAEMVDLISKQIVEYFLTPEVVVTYEDYPDAMEVNFSSFYHSLPRVPEDVSVEDARGSIAHRPILG